MASTVCRTSLQLFPVFKQRPSQLLLHSNHGSQTNNYILQRTFSSLKFLRRLSCVSHNANSQLKLGDETKKTFYSCNHHDGVTHKPTLNHSSHSSLPERPLCPAIQFDANVFPSSLKNSTLHHKHNCEHGHRRNFHNLSPFQRSTSSLNQPLLFTHPFLSKARNSCQNNFCQPRAFSIAKSILDSSPDLWQPYLRLIRFDKPIGTWLLYWPCTWSIALAAQPGSLPDLKMLALFGAGSFFMRGAGCIINDMWDKDFDSKVARTKERPLASGELSYFQALTFLGCQLSISLAILLQLNWYTVFLGASSMIFVITYPLAKRFTYWPQIVLGLTLNWGVLLSWSGIQGALQLPALLLYGACTSYTVIYDTIYSHQVKMLQANGHPPQSLPDALTYNLKCLTFNYGALVGWSAIQGSVDWSVCLPLYGSCILWTLVYDTIYAHQDKYDDMLVGVKSTALRLGEQTKPWLTTFTAIMASGLVSCGLTLDMPWPYYAGVGLTTARLLQQIYSVNLDDADQCGQAFRGNFYLGVVMFAGIVLANLMKSEKKNETDLEEKDATVE